MEATRAREKADERKSREVDTDASTGVGKMTTKQQMEATLGASFHLSLNLSTDLLSRIRCQKRNDLGVGQKAACRGGQGAENAWKGARKALRFSDVGRGSNATSDEIAQR